MQTIFVCNVPPSDPTESLPLPTMNFAKPEDERPQGDDPRADHGQERPGQDNVGDVETLELPRMDFGQK